MCALAGHEANDAPALVKVVMGGWLCLGMG